MCIAHARTYETISTEKMNKHYPSQDDLGYKVYRPLMPAFFLLCPSTPCLLPFSPHATEALSLSRFPLSRQFQRDPYVLDLTLLWKIFFVLSNLPSTGMKL